MAVTANRSASITVLAVAVLTGWPAAVYNLSLAAVILFAGIGLLRLKRAAWVTAIAYFVFTVLNSVVFFFAPGGHARMMRLLAMQQSTFSWTRGSPDIYRQMDPTLFLLMGAVGGLFLSLIPLYFLIQEKPAFVKSAPPAAWISFRAAMAEMSGAQTVL